MWCEAPLRWALSLEQSGRSERTLLAALHRVALKKSRLNNPSLSIEMRPANKFNYVSLKIELDSFRISKYQNAASLAIGSGVRLV